MWWLRGIHEIPVGRAGVGFGYCYGEIITARPPKDVLLISLNIMGLKRGKSKILKSWRPYVMSSEKNFKSYLRTYWNQQWDSASKKEGLVPVIFTKMSTQHKGGDYSVLFCTMESIPEMD